ncbi:MAG: hypothetical protein RL026_1042 [Pseudomonadota bacterium]|jgi:spermidine synthase
MSPWRKIGQGIAVLALAGAASVCGAQMRVVHSEKSLYREVLVYEQAGERCMCFTRQCRIGRQSCLEIARPRHLALSYTHMMLAGTLLTRAEPPRSVLVVGLGGGSIPGALRELLPDARIDVVEIDPAVTRVARRFFGFQDGALTRVAEVDGRVFIKRALRGTQRYDAVLLDAFDHEYIPEHLLTREFLEEVKALLAPGGVLVANTFSSSRLYDHESATYAAVFGSFFNLKRDNRVIVARPAGLPTATDLAQRAARWEEPLRRFDVTLAPLLPMFSREVDWDRSARVLTDQYSPANLLNR